MNSFSLYKKASLILLTCLSLATISCRKEKDPGIKLINSISNFREIASAVVIVNPVINKGSTTTVIPGTQRSDMPIQTANL